MSTTHEPATMSTAEVMQNVVEHCRSCEAARDGHVCQASGRHRLHYVSLDGSVMVTWVDGAS